MHIASPHSIMDAKYWIIHKLKKLPDIFGLNSLMQKTEVVFENLLLESNCHIFKILNECCYVAKWINDQNRIKDKIDETNWKI